MPIHPAIRLTVDEDRPQTDPMSSSQRPIVISFSSPKGGVGKSTTCACLAGSLAARGHKVHILDTDTNRTLADWVSDFPQDTTGITVEAIPEGTNLLSHLRELCATLDGFIFVDVAGAWETYALAAASVADLVISPAKLNVPDLKMAAKTRAFLDHLATTLGHPITHRVLINEVSALASSHYQQGAFKSLERAPFTAFKTLIVNRAPFAEIFSTGQTPHFADQGREPVKKAVAQLDELTDEVLAVIGIAGQIETVPTKIAA